MKTKIEKIKRWWTWIETCDECGKIIHGHEIRHSNKPDINEMDYCSSCFRSLIDKGILPKIWR